MSEELKQFIIDEQINERIFKEHPQTFTFEFFIEMMDKFRNYQKIES